MTTLKRSILPSLFTAFLAILLSSSSTAQPNVDITLLDNGNNELEVRIRPDGPFDGIFSSLAFTIRWNENDGADLGFVSQTAPSIFYMPTGKSGDQIDDNGNRYQIFAGFGFSSLSANGAAWVANTEYTIFTIPVLNGTSAFEIVNDNWTNEMNGDYFVSLGGVNTTGMIYSTATGIEVGPREDLILNVHPNPNNGEFTLDITSEHSSDLNIEILNSVGQIMRTESLENFSGTYKNDLDLTSESKGVYFIRISNEENSTIHRFVVE